MVLPPGTKPRSLHAGKDLLLSVPVLKQPLKLTGHHYCRKITTGSMEVKRIYKENVSRFLFFFKYFNIPDQVLHLQW